MTHRYFDIWAYLERRSVYQIDKSDALSLMHGYAYISVSFLLVSYDTGNNIVSFTNRPYISNDNVGDLDHF